MEHGTESTVEEMHERHKSNRRVPTAPEAPVSALWDHEVLAASRAKMRPSQGRRLSELLERQREGALSDEERSELLTLMQTDNRVWIRQSEALAEAVRRGLRDPLR